MNIIEARRARHLLLRVDRGEELPSAVLRALDQAEARAAWIHGIGSLEAAELALFDQASRTYGKARRIEGPADILSLQGNVAVHEGAGFLRMSATLARETDVGLVIFGGELVWARAYAVELHVVAFDDLALSRSFDDRTGLALLTSRGGSDSVRPAPPPEPIRLAASTEPTRPSFAPEAPRLASAAEAPRAPAATTYGTSTEPPAQAPALPTRPVRPQEDVEVYPEVGDHVSHFHFGECVVLSSDGDRIRLRQDRDGRVREVSLTMLKIEDPTIHPESGKRHFRLARKH
jgi:predicted DNA-binding protein with PD1-like motif